MVHRKANVACEIAAKRDCRRRGRERLLTRCRLSLIAALLLLISALATAPAVADQLRTVALLGVQFLNDHEALEPTTDAERARLRSLAELLKSKLEATGRYKFLPITDRLAAKIAAGPEIGNCGGCEFDYGKKIGTDLAAWIVVQKVSNLILNINVYVADVALRKLSFVHSVDIRGDTDESWTMGMTYLIKNYMLPNQL